MHVLALIILLLLAACSEEGADSEAPSSSRATENGESAEAPSIRDTFLDRIGSVPEPLGHHAEDRYRASLATIREKRFLRVLTSLNDFDYFIHDGARGGYQYEMVRAFTGHLNERHERKRGEPEIQFELIPVDDDQMIPLLLEGMGDLIAARLTITPERAERLRFSRAYRSVDELLVTHDRTPPLSSVEDLSGREVAVRAGSSYAESLATLNRELAKSDRAPVKVVFVDEALATENILELVAARRYAFTVADSLVAELAASIHPSLQIVEGVALRRDGQLAWATLPTAPALAEEMDGFLRRYREGTLLGNHAAQRYFDAESRLARRFVEEEDGISDFDAIFREQAETFGLDWRLVAAMAYQESRFDPKARSRFGAVGLLQIKPTTAREPYVDIPNVEGVENARDNVRAGLKYLMWIKERYFDSQPDMRERDRLRMALAAYNAGPRLVQRARNRAEKTGLDPNRWFRNVELAMLGLRRSQPVKYVSEINQRYLSYVLLGLD